jgi:hypothetical protein
LAAGYQLIHNGQVVGRWGPGDKLEHFLSDAIADLKGAPRPPRPTNGAPMKEKLAALREYNAQQRRILNGKIDAVMAKAQEVYPRAHAAAEQQLAEVDGIEQEIVALEDEANQAMGGNNPPQGG